MIEIMDIYVKFEKTQQNFDAFGYKFSHINLNEDANSDNGSLHLNWVY